MAEEDSDLPPKGVFKKKPSTARIRSANAWMMMQMADDDQSKAEKSRKEKDKQKKIAMLNAMLEDDDVDEREDEINLGIFENENSGKIPDTHRRGEGKRQRKRADEEEDAKKQDFGSLSGRHGDATKLRAPSVDENKTDFGSLSGQHGDATPPDDELRIYMKKRGLVNTALKRRYFVLKRDVLAYFKDKTAFEQGQPPRGSIVLSGCRLQTPGSLRVVVTDVTKSTSARRGQGLMGKIYRSQSSGDDENDAEYHLVAESESDLAALVDAIERAQEMYPLADAKKESDASRMRSTSSSPSPPRSPILGALSSAARRLMSPRRQDQRSDKLGRDGDIYDSSSPKLQSAGWGVSKMAKRAASLAGSLASSLAGSRNASRAGSEVGSDAASDREVDMSRQDAFSHGSGASLEILDQEVQADEQVMHWRAVAQEELADRLEVQRTLREEENLLRSALEDEERCLREEREQDAEIEELHAETRELLSELSPLEDLVHVLESALRERDAQEQERHAEDVAVLLAENQALEEENARLLSRGASEKAVLLRLKSACWLRRDPQMGLIPVEKWNELEESAAHRYPPAEAPGVRARTASGSDGRGSDENTTSGGERKNVTSFSMAEFDHAADEDTVVQLLAENSAALRLCRHVTSDIRTVLKVHGSASGADEHASRDVSFGTGANAFGSTRRHLASMLTISDERIRRNLLEVLRLQELLHRVRDEAATHWGALQALQSERACLAAQAELLQRQSAHLTSLLYRPRTEEGEALSKRGGVAGDAMHPRSMIGVGICLRDARTSHEPMGPIVRAVHAGTHPARQLTHGHQALRVLDEIVEIQGRDARGLGAEAVMRIMTDAPGTSSVLKVRRGSEVVQLDIKRPSEQQRRDASGWRSNAQQAMQALQVQQALSDLALTFATAAGQVRGREAKALWARGEAEARDRQLHRLRISNHQLLSRLKALEPLPPFQAPA